MAKNLIEKIVGKKKPKVTDELLEKQFNAKEKIKGEIAELYKEVEEIWAEIQEIRGDITANTLLELLIIHRKLKFPTGKPQIPFFDEDPRKIELTDNDGILETIGSSLALGFLSLISQKRYINTKRKINKKNKQKRHQRQTEWKKQVEEVQTYLKKLEAFKASSVDELTQSREALQALHNRLERLKLVVESGYSTQGPQLLKNESSEPETAFTIPFSGRFDVTSKNKVYIKVGAATEAELRKKDSDIPQLKLLVSCPLEGGTVSVSFELTGDIPLTFDLERDVAFVSTAIGQSAAITIVNDLLALTSQDNNEDDDFDEDWDDESSDSTDVVVRKSSTFNNVLEIPFAFATDKHVAEDIAAKIYAFSAGAIVVKPTHILKALAVVKDLDGANAAPELANILEFTANNAQLQRSWAQGGSLVNADLLIDMGLVNTIGTKKINIMLRTGAIKYPWQYVVCVLAVAEGRPDLLDDLQQGRLSPTKLYSKLDASNVNLDFRSGQGAQQLLDDGDDNMEHPDSERNIELSHTGSQVLNAIDPTNTYYPTQMVKLQKAVQIILDPDFQRGLLDPEAIAKRKAALVRVGKLVTGVRNAKLDMLSEELQLELDSLELAVEKFRESAKDLKPEIAAAIVSKMVARARKLAVEIPELSQLDLSKESEKEQDE